VARSGKHLYRLHCALRRGERNQRDRGVSMLGGGIMGLAKRIIQN